MKRRDKEQLMEGEWSHKYKKLNSFLRESNLSDSAVMEWRFISPWALVVARHPYQANDNIHGVQLIAFTLWMLVESPKKQLSTSFFTSNCFPDHQSTDSVPVWNVSLWEKKKKNKNKRFHETKVRVCQGWSIPRRSPKNPELSVVSSSHHQA